MAMAKKMGRSEATQYRGSRPREPVCLDAFSDVDCCGNPHSLVDYLDSTHANDQALAGRQHLLHALAPREGDHLLDVGCGIGHMTIALAHLVGNTGMVTGIDRSRTMIDEARRRLRLRGDLPIAFRVEDAHWLSFADLSFDAALVVSTLVYVRQPRQVLSEIRRVLKPGGRIALLECDWHSLVVKTGLPVIDRTTTALLRGSFRNGSIGHQLPALLEELGFQDITVRGGTMRTYDLAVADRAWRIAASIRKADECGAWPAGRATLVLGGLAKADQEARFLGRLTGYAVVGRSPLRPLSSAENQKIEAVRPPAQQECWSPHATIHRGFGLCSCAEGSEGLST